MSFSRTRPAVRRAAVSLAAAGALLTVGAAAQPATVKAAGMEIAVQDDNVFLYPYGLFNVDGAYALARGIGARAIRFNVIWGEYQQFCRDPRFQGNCFKPYDDAINAARRNGFKVQLTVAGTPEYEPTLSQYVSFRRPNSTRYRIFLTRVAKRYRNKVFRYSIWNEPNLARWVSPTRSAPAYYARLVKVGYRALKKVDRRIQVLMGEFTSANDPLSFMQRMGGGIRADGLAYHPFEFLVAPGRRSRAFIGINSTPRIQSTLRDLARRGRIRTPGGGALPLYYTEFDYQTAGRYARYTRPESKRARYSLAAFRLVKRYGVKQMLWYMLFHPPKILLSGDTWDGGIVGLNGVKDVTYNTLAANRRSYGG
jgi:hypothetical protein